DAQLVAPLHEQGVEQGVVILRRPQGLTKAVDGGPGAFASEGLVELIEQGGFHDKVPAGAGGSTVMLPPRARSGGGPPPKRRPHGGECESGRRVCRGDPRADLSSG